MSNRVNPVEDFGILKESAAYLDHAASSLTPDVVLDAMNAYYLEYRANVHRGVYPWSAKATWAYEQARETVASFIGAGASSLVFTQGATASINLMIECYFRHQIKASQVILLTEIEHHANLIPWQRLAASVGASIKYIPMDEHWDIQWGELEAMVAAHDVAVMAITHASNVLGVAYDIQRLSQLGVPVCVDGAQRVAHHAVDVTQLGCAMYAFSAHKMYGPTGIGALYIHPDYHDKIQPHFTGGGIVDWVTYEHATFQPGIQVLEPGTPNIAGAIGFARAVQYIQSLSFQCIESIESQVFDYFLEQVSQFSLSTYSPHQHVVYSFLHPNIHAHDLATLLGDKGVMVRAGHHCCMPLMDKLGVNALTRVSLGVYNTKDDVDRFVDALGYCEEVMGV